MRASSTAAATGVLGLVLSSMVCAGPSSGAPADDPIDLSSRDTTCAPCRDFFGYANGGWVARTPIPASYSDYGSFRELSDKNQEALHELLEAAARRLADPTDGNRWKLGAYYGTCMDSLGADAAGVRPIEPDLERIVAIRTHAGLTLEVARLHAQGVGALFRFASAQDAKHSEEVIAVAGQGGLGLPDRDYYTREDSTSRALRGEYVAHIARTFVLLGRPAARARGEAERVMAIETALARASMTNVQRRDPKATYHRMPVADLRALAPKFGWDAYLRQAGLAGIADLNVAQPDFFKAMNGLFGGVPLGDWKSYLRWKLLDDAAPLLSRAFVDEDFEFDRRLSGAQELLPRWKRCLRATDEALGEALGQAYVARYFPPEARVRALEMVHNLESALGERLSALAWMGDSTRAQAMAKLQAFEEKIGYPNQWRDYSRLDVERGPFPQNRAGARAFEVARQLAKIGRPVDRAEWNMTPPTVNAYYSSSLNTINFPAGILQPPFFDPNADDAVNYGGIGAVIGHEMTHGFDDRGRQFDGKGNLRDWWTADDEAQYKARAARVVDQFNGYVAVDTLHVNGKLTLGENIADLGGLAVAYAAFEKSLAGKPRTLMHGFTPEQRFFLSWAQVWREVMRPEFARTLVQTNPHSPGVWRVNGPLSNLPEFAAAWGCRPGDPMVRPDSLRARIW